MQSVPNALACLPLSARTSSNDHAGGMSAANEVFDVYSLDVFDTLLLRSLRSERSRFLQIARLASRNLAELGIEVAAMRLLKARLEVQAQAYRALEATNPSGDVRLADMLETVSTMLDLGPEGARVLGEAEMAVELRCLRPNKALLARLRREGDGTRRFIAVSDTYLPAPAVWLLLDTLAPGHPVQAVYTSADHNATKRGADLFGYVLAAEGVQPDRLLHHGDDRTADDLMAKRAGVRTSLRRRPAWVRFLRKLDGLLFRLRRPLHLS